MRKDILELTQQTLNEFSDYLRERANDSCTSRLEYLSEEELRAELYYLTAELVASSSGRKIEELPEIDMDLVEKGEKAKATWVEAGHEPYLHISDEELGGQIADFIEPVLSSLDIPSSWRFLWERGMK